MNVRTSGRIKVISDPNEFQYRINNDAFPPVMSYFESQKITTSGVNFIEEQRRRFDELVRGADTVVVVGLRVRVHDEHIWSPLKDSPARMVYCGGNAAGEEFRDWSEAQRSESDDLVLSGYFLDEFESLLEELGV